ncbi:MAG: hypothetical protein MJ252_24250 [archaeon]|nr:hypothetical protein [archaeon]
MEASLQDFIGKVTRGHTIIKTMEQKTSELGIEKTKISSATDSTQKKNISNRIEGILNDVYSKQTEMKQILNDLTADLSSEGKKESGKKLEQENELLTNPQNTEVNEENKTEKKEENTPEKRIKQNLFKSLVKKYQDAAMNFQEVQSSVKSLMQNNIIRTAEIALDRKLNEQEKHDIINDPQTVQKFYENNLKGTAHVRLQNAVADLEDRSRDIKKLEKSLNDLHVLVVELSSLVQLQGEMIDNICDNIGAAKDYVNKGVENLKEAKENIKKASKKKCIVLIIVAVVAAVVIIVPIVTKVL